MTNQDRRNARISELKEQLEKCIEQEKGLHEQVIEARIRAKAMEMKFSWLDIVTTQLIPKTTGEWAMELYRKILTPSEASEEDQEKVFEFTREEILKKLQFMIKFTRPFRRRVEIYGEEFEKAKEVFEEEIRKSKELLKQMENITSELRELTLMNEEEANSNA